MTDNQTNSGTTGRSRNYLESLRGDLQDLQGPRALITELIQNADDAYGATRMRFEVASAGLTIWNDGEFSKCQDIHADSCGLMQPGQSRCDFHSFREVSGAAKRERFDATGAFGIGFTSVYQITDRPVLLSSGVRWEIDETKREHERISWRLEPDTTGTTFEFPWARSPSEMRSGVGQEPVTDALIEDLTQELRGVVPESMLFLRRLDEIEIVVDGESLRFSREHDGDVTTIGGSDGSTRRWLMLSTELGDQGTELKRRHAGLIQADRALAVDVAVRLDEPSASGSYYATLPTELPTGLPASVNGSFFPKRDRKSLLTDGSPRGIWNRAIIDDAAQLLASNLERVVDLVGDLLVTQTLLRGPPHARVGATGLGLVALPTLATSIVGVAEDSPRGAVDDRHGGHHSDCSRVECRRGAGSGSAPAGHRDRTRERGHETRLVRAAQLSGRDRRAPAPTPHIRARRPHTP